MPTFGSVLTAMVTPFAADGSLDLDGAQRLARWLVANGNDGVVVAGTTGESATLTHDEQIELTVAVREAIPDASLVAGAGSNDTSAAVELTERATAAGADGILTVTPYYNRPSQAGIEAHFRAVAAATDRPVLIYDIPIRTGRKVSESTLQRLFAVDNIIGTKDAAKDPAGTAALIARAPKPIEVYSGDDSLTLAFLAVGAVGVIGVATHWCGVEMAAMVAAHRDGNVAEARRINAMMIASYEFEGTDDAPNPVPSKAMMNLMGVAVGECRPPMGFAPDDLDDRARSVLAGLGRPL
jgi:4-hydroxy-tetrahydrodipicolinate synthase